MRYPVGRLSRWLRGVHLPLGVIASVLLVSPGQAYVASETVSNRFDVWPMSLASEAVSNRFDLFVPVSLSVLEISSAVGVVPVPLVVCAALHTDVIRQTRTGGGAMKRWRVCLGSAALCAGFAFMSVVPAWAEPIVSNAVTSQRMDGSQIVDITYNMAGAIPGTFVSLRISTDDGVTWPIAPSPANVSGDIGPVSTNGAKSFVYRAKADLSRTSTSLARAKVIAFVNDALTIQLPGGVPMELIRIPAGTFTMGSPAGELSRGMDETQFQGLLSQAAYMGKTEVTQQQWLAVRGSWPGRAPSSTNGLGDNYPAYNVSWDDAQNFITSLNAHIVSSGQGPATVRLPTEAEWEYACRAGTTTRFSFGNGLGADEYCSAEAERVNNMWYCGNNSPFGSKVVAQKYANAFGLNDMHGNVWEWCQDWYGTYRTWPTRSDRAADGLEPGGPRRRLGQRRRELPVGAARQLHADEPAHQHRVPRPRSPVKRAERLVDPGFC